MHWPAPITTQSIANDRGPVLVTVEYRIRPHDREAFFEAIAKLEHARRRDGAYAWGIFEDTAEEGRMVETFLVESWMEHLRQHERVTNADRVVQDAVDRFHAERRAQGHPLRRRGGLGWRARRASSRWRVSLSRWTQTVPPAISISLRQQGLCAMRQ